MHHTFKNHHNDWTYRDRKKESQSIMEKNDITIFKSQLKRNFGGLFAPGREIFITRAPGRLDIMGGVADYSGSVALEFPLKAATIVAIQKRRDRRILLKSMNIEKYGLTPILNFHLDDFYHSGKLRTYDNFKKQFQGNLKTQWVAYVLGAFLALLREGLAEKFSDGVTIGIQSDIPFGVGLASSASLEVAAMLAIQRVYQLQLTEFQIARSCQIVENSVVGAACGIMDQVTCTMGQKNNILALRCQPHELLKHMPVPQTIRFVGINSGVRHSVTGPHYTDTRIGTFMGRKILFDSLQTSGREPYDGYLCNITVEEWNSKFKKIIPPHIKGEDFINKYKNHGDSATKIDSEKIYHPKQCAEHPIFENYRANKFMEFFESYLASSDENNLINMGNLMYDSHNSYDKNCNLKSKETDIIVSLVKEYGSKHGLYGAKITGGGCGGTVAVLAARGSEDIIRKIASQYEDMTKLQPDLFFDSSSGALEHGVAQTKMI
jgi:galactokinase